MFTKDFWKATAIRGIRTFAQAMLAYIGTGAVLLHEVNWIAALSAGGMGLILSVLMAIAYPAGIPEAEKTE